MADEKIYTIPLRKAYRSKKNTRAKKAMTIIREFLERHMKKDNIKIGKSINESVWARSMQSPPRKIRIHAILENDAIYAELVGVDIKKPTAEQVEKKDKKKKEKEEKIKEDRKERKKLTIQEEIKKETGEQPAAHNKASDIPNIAPIESKEI